MRAIAIIAVCTVLAHFAVHSAPTTYGAGIPQIGGGSPRLRSRRASELGNDNTVTATAAAGRQRVPWWRRCAQYWPRQWRKSVANIGALLRKLRRAAHRAKNFVFRGVDGEHPAAGGGDQGEVEEQMDADAEKGEEKVESGEIDELESNIEADEDADNDDGTVNGREGDVEVKDGYKEEAEEVDAHDVDTEDDGGDDFVDQRDDQEVYGIHDCGGPTIAAVSPERPVSRAETTTPAASHGGALSFADELDERLNHVLRNKPRRSSWSAGTDAPNTAAASVRESLANTPPGHLDFDPLATGLLSPGTPISSPAITRTPPLVREPDDYFAAAHDSPHSESGDGEEPDEDVEASTHHLGGAAFGEALESSHRRYVDEQHEQRWRDRFRQLHQTSFAGRIAQPSIPQMHRRSTFGAGTAQAPPISPWVKMQQQQQQQQPPPSMWQQSAARYGGMSQLAQLRVRLPVFPPGMLTKADPSSSPNSLAGLTHMQRTWQQQQQQQHGFLPLLSPLAVGLTGAAPTPGPSRARESPPHASDGYFTHAGRSRYHQIMDPTN